MNQIYDQCCRFHGRTVRITCNDGRVHVGEITRVNRDMVWIRPTGGLGGYGLGFFGEVLDSDVDLDVDLVLDLA